MATYHNDGFYWSRSRFTYNSEEQKTNVRYILNFFRGKGWTDNAIAGILGNMQSESGMNPGAYYDYKSFSSVSYGVVQWDPTSKYQKWHDSTYPGIMYDHLGCQLNRIIWELENGEQYYKTEAYPLTFRQFTQSTETPEYLGAAFVRNYERPASVVGKNATDATRAETYKTRGDQARHWWNYIQTLGGGGGTVPTPTPPSTEETPANKTMYCIVDSGEYVNIRSGPSTSDSVIGKLYRGDSVYVVSTVGQWAKINSPMEGYVMLSFLQDDSINTDTPVVPGEPSNIINFLTIYKGRRYRVVR